MTRLCVAPIVEGHGEVEAVRQLLWKVWVDYLGCEHVSVLRPIRKPRYSIVKEPELKRAVDLAARKLLAECPDGKQLILILLDSEDDPACILGPVLLRQARESRADTDIAAVLASCEYETWFVASADSMGKLVDLPATPPDDPEGNRLGKRWIERHFRGFYSESVDQARLTDLLDVELCRRRSPSFDKLCRELESRS